MRQNAFLRNTKPIQLSINETYFLREGGDSLQGTIWGGGEIVNMIPHFLKTHFPADAIQSTKKTNFA